MPQIPVLVDADVWQQRGDAMNWAMVVTCVGLVGWLPLGVLVEARLERWIDQRWPAK